MERNILIVDDDPNLLAALRRRLGRKYHVTTVMSAEDGLSAVDEQGPYGVVLGEHRVQGLDGVSFLRRLSEGVPDTIRILLTGKFDAATEKLAAEEAEVLGFLTKPCAFEDLVAAIEAGLGRTVDGAAQAA